MRLSTRLTMLGLSRTLKAMAHARAEALDTPRDREPPGRRLAARRKRRALERGGGDGRHGA
jgi:hypothetical protein